MFANLMRMGSTAGSSLRGIRLVVACAAGVALIVGGISGGSIDKVVAGAERVSAALYEADASLNEGTTMPTDGVVGPCTNNEESEVTSGH